MRHKNSSPFAVINQLSYIKYQKGSITPTQIYVVADIGTVTDTNAGVIIIIIVVVVGMVKRNNFELC